MRKEVCWLLTSCNLLSLCCRISIAECWKCPSYSHGIFHDTSKSWYQFQTQIFLYNFHFNSLNMTTTHLSRLRHQWPYEYTTLLINLECLNPNFFTWVDKRTFYKWPLYLTAAHQLLLILSRKQTFRYFGSYLPQYHPHHRPRLWRLNIGPYINHAPLSTTLPRLI